MHTEMWLEMLQRADRSEEGDDIKMDLSVKIWWMWI
jgi:hypothetical protein